MPCQLPADCLNEIFEYLEGDITTLHSCLLVNRLWCEVSVRILWRNIWNFKYTYSTESILSKILITLYSCLPDESKELLYINGIFITTPPPLFNYASFCKVLSIGLIHEMIKNFLISQQSIVDSGRLKKDIDLLTQEIFKMFMKQVSSFKNLTYYLDNIIISNDITFAHFPGARNCLANLLELSCDSSIHSEFIRQLTGICNNIQSLNIKLGSAVSDGLKNFISSQNSLKYLSLTQSNDSADWTNIILSLTKHSNTLIKLIFKKEDLYNPHSLSVPLSFITKFTNLQELIISFKYNLAFENFSAFQYASFPQLKVLKFLYKYPDIDILIKFLENNGENLIEFYVYTCSNQLNLSIAKFCPNLRSLFVLFNLFTYKIETLISIFKSCQQLESLKAWCGNIYFKEKEMLETIVKYSPKNFYELKLYNFAKSELISEDLETFFINWNKRIPQKSLSLVVFKSIGYFGDYSLTRNRENMRMIEKYKKLGIIKKFKIEKAEEYEILY